MSIATATVQGRRTLKFASFDEVIADAEKLVLSPPTKMLGNWPLSQLLAHLATAINLSIDGISARMPWYVRLYGYFIKGRLIKNGMPAGFRLPKEAEAVVFPPTSSAQDGLDTLRMAVSRLQTEKMTATHPVLGKMNHDEWTQFHLRHAEMHLSFALPD